MNGNAHLTMIRGATFLVALSSFDAQASVEDVGHLPAVQDRTLIRFAELCTETDGMGHDEIVAAFDEAGFMPVETIKPELDTFFDVREASFRARGETNEGMFQSSKAHVDVPFGTPPIFFDGPEDWVALVRTDTHLALMNDVPVGNGHVCRFFGYGWTEEVDAEAAFATLVGEDFLGRGRTLPSHDWRYNFSGIERGPEPRANFGVWAVKGASGAIAPTITVDWMIVHDMTVPPWVVSKQ